MSLMITQVEILKKIKFVKKMKKINIIYFLLKIIIRKFKNNKMNTLQKLRINFKTKIGVITVQTHFRKLLKF